MDLDLPSMKHPQGNLGRYHKTQPYIGSKHHSHNAKLHAENDGSHKVPYILQKDFLSNMHSGLDSIMKSQPVLRGDIAATAVGISLAYIRDVDMYIRFENVVRPTPEDCFKPYNDKKALTNVLKTMEFEL